ncbi:VOC family protein [Streptomyces fenghuangensis]|uniref:VOC family protein n=1 Tax=Streptomyces sp. ICN903 TaxID=2964654 RepID=UPI001EDC8ED5|nr:VOC family protein [Streptomyces sp. ICN903]MCG3040917.1 VOC family protein [Streptomyces sp. ICN903]
MSETPHGRLPHRPHGPAREDGFPGELSGVVLDAPDPRTLAAFYRRLLGWETVRDEPDWVSLKGPGATKLSFQTEPEYRPPTWPGRSDRQQMMLHLDFRVDDLEAAHEHAVAAGATLADFQPQDGVRVYTDPVGHVFCLFVDD